MGGCHLKIWHSYLNFIKPHTFILAVYVSAFTLQLIQIFLNYILAVYINDVLHKPPTPFFITCNFFDLCFTFRKFVLLVFPVFDKNQSILRLYFSLKVNQNCPGVFWHRIKKPKCEIPARV